MVHSLYINVINCFSISVLWTFLSSCWCVFSVSSSVSTLQASLWEHQPNINDNDAPLTSLTLTQARCTHACAINEWHPSACAGVCQISYCAWAGERGGWQKGGRDRRLERRCNTRDADRKRRRRGFNKKRWLHGDLPARRERKGGKERKECDICSSSLQTNVTHEGGRLPGCLNLLH